MKEIWKDIKGYENLYQVSDLGNVKRLESVSSYTYKGNENDVRYRKWNGHNVKKTMTKTQQYLMVGLTKNGKYRLLTIHGLVATAFLNHISDKYNGLIIDHINNIKTDNRLINLRLVTPRENVSKARLLKNKTSKYTGVYYKSKNKKWCASIYVDGKKKHLGLFDDEYKAHLAYQKELKTSVY